MSKLLTKTDWVELLPKLKYILSDCDGVLWNSDRAIDGSVDCFKKFRELGKQICYVTNNNTKTREQCMEKCHKLGFQANIDEVYGTAYATAAYLKNVGVNSVYLIGNSAMHHELTSLDIKCNEVGPDSMDGKSKTWLNVKLEKGIQAVVVGFDEYFSMAKVCRASSYLLDPKCLFVVTNQDQFLPTDRKDILVPGTGCQTICVETATGRQPIVVGKPNPTMIELLKSQFPDLSPENALFIGDRLNTDIELGRRQGFKTLLVETGAHKRSDIDSQKPPTYYLPSLKDLHGFMN